TTLLRIRPDAMTTLRPSKQRIRERLRGMRYQSLPSGLPSSGMHAFSHVVTETMVETLRTLASPSRTGMAPACGDDVTCGLQNPWAGAIWNGRDPDRTSMLAATTPLRFRAVGFCPLRARYAPIPNTAMFQ